MSENMTQNMPATMGCGMLANSAPNLPAHRAGRGWGHGGPRPFQDCRACRNLPLSHVYPLITIQPLQRTASGDQGSERAPDAHRSGPGTA
jgi:hypothetical protein